MTHHHHHHTLSHWIEFAEHSVFRSLLMMIGVVLVVIGLGLGVTVVMLPAGLAVGFTGVGLFLWGAMGDLPLDD